MESIKARGVRVHNLKNVDVDIPRGKLVAICGVSGSGKTSLALDTLYAEGQRRYIESFSAYTRQFLERLEKPDYDSIEGLPPALAVTRGSAPRGNRSTVGTASETLDFLRLVFANASELICYGCGDRVESHDPQSVASVIQSLPKCKLMLGFETEWEDVGDRATVLSDLQTQGFVRLIGGGRVLNLGADAREELAESLPASGKVCVVVDRLKGGDDAARTTESLETAFEQGYGSVVIFADLVDESTPLDNSLREATGASATSSSIEELDGKRWTVLRFSRQRTCTKCQIDYPEPEARLFSFNSPLGACPKCEGFGDTIDLDWNLIVPDRSLSIADGAIAPWNSPAYEHNLDELLDIADDLGLPVDVPFSKLGKKQMRLLMEGDERQGFEGIAGFFRWLERKKYKMHVRVFISRWRSYNTCDACKGARLSPEALAYKFAGKSFAELCELGIDELVDVLATVVLSARDAEVVANPLSQVCSRLGYLQAVGLGYLQLSRTLRTLSGGEAQRTALTAALGSNLVNMLYVLDEPTVGLHPHDVQQLVQSIEKLAERGNTVVIVEHEEALLQRADHLIEIGPAAGQRGGEVVFSGALIEKPANKGKSTGSQTLDFLTGKRCVPVPINRRASRKSIAIKGCRGNNLKDLETEFPLGVLCVVTGVSGSGKSSLVQDTLYHAVAKRLSYSEKKSTTLGLPFDSLKGLGQIDDCILVDQSPVSRSPRSNPVTYVKAFDEIRKAFADTSDAKLKGLTAGHFSFNSDLGRCPNCSGDGVLQIDMQFLADVHMTCPTCDGKRYRREVLNVRYRDLSIADVLRLTVAEASEFFRGSKKVKEKLQVLKDVGLDYLQLGQSATTLSSGEAQRLKLAGFLASASRKNTLFILDEPTTGLHFVDITKLLSCFNALLEAGHSLIVIEHNMNLIAAADHVIDLGPGAASEGGTIVAAGTPEEIANVPESRTGSFLKTTLKNR